MKRIMIMAIAAFVILGMGYWTFWGSPESPQQLMKIFNGIEHGRVGWVDFRTRMDILPRPVQERLASYLVQKLTDQELGKFIWNNIDGDYTKVFFSKSMPASNELLDRLRKVRWERKEWNSILNATNRHIKEQTALTLVSKIPSHMLYNFVFSSHEKCEGM